MAYHGEVLVFPSLVRARVLEQHDELRGMLAGLIADVSALDPLSTLDRERLEAATRELGAHFRAHLAFEEEELTHVLAVLDPWGPERVKDMHDEHERQRRELEALLGRFGNEADAACLVDAVAGLAADLLSDMADEERGRLRPGLLDADVLTIERR